MIVPANLNQLVDVISTKTKVKVITENNQILFSGYAYELASTETLVSFGNNKLYKVEVANNHIIIILE